MTASRTIGSGRSSRNSTPQGWQPPRTWPCSIPLRTTTAMGSPC
jgi:hypothetical protein